MLMKLLIYAQVLLRLFCKQQIKHFPVLILTSTNRRMLGVKIYTVLKHIP